jgi:PAS domain S-box-containing protein
VTDPVSIGTSLFQGAPLSVIVADREGRVLCINPAFERLTGWLDDDVRGRDWFETCVPEHDREGARARFLATGEQAPAFGHLAILTRSGERREIDWHGVVQRDQDGRCAGFLAIGVDVTARWQAEQDAARVRSMLQTIVDSTPDLIFIKDPAHRVLFANRAFGDFMGCDAAALVGQADTDLFPADLCLGDPARGIHGYRADDNAALAGQTLHNPDDVARLSDGTERIFDTVKVPIHGPDGRPYAVLGYSRDVTERRHVENRSHLDHAALESASNGIAFATLEGHLVYVNPSFLDLWGYADAAGVLGRLATDFWERPEDAAAVIGHLERAGRWAGEMIGLRADGQRINVEVSAHMVNDRDGHPARLMASFRDITSQKKVEEALRRREELLRTVVSGAPLAIYALDREGRFTLSDGLALAQIGLQPGQVVGMSAFDLYAAVPGMVENMTRALAGETVNYQSSVGATWFDATYAPLRDAEGRIEGVVGVAIDITERRLAEEALRQSEANLRSIADNANAGIMVVQDGRAVFANRHLATLGGYDVAALTATDPFSLIAPERQAALIDLHLRRVSGSEAPSRYETVARTTGGRLIDLEVNAAGITWNGRPATSVVLIDIGERKRTERRFHDLFEFAPDGILIIDNEGRVKVANPRAASMFGYPPEGLPGLPVETLVVESVQQPDRSRPFFSDATPQAMGARRHNLRGRQQDGATFPVDISLSPMQSDEGVLTVVMVRDITERVDAERERQSLEAQLRHAQKIEALGTLAGGIAHDFNNILGAVVGHLDMATHHAAGNPEVVRSLEGVRRASDRARELVRQILAFSKPQLTSKRGTNLKAVVDEAVSLLRAAIPTAVQLRVTGHDDAPDVLVDPTQIHQVVMNLCTNAWQALDHQRGSIEVELAGVTLDDEAASRHSALAPGRYACLSVSDTGRGMDATTVGRAFEPFFTTKPPGEGTGLGLSVVHGIMRANGGAIEVESEPGRGSTFHLFFPAATAEADWSANTAAVEDSIRGKGQRVLLVDDEEELVRVGEDGLILSGYRVSAYTRPVEALEALLADPSSFAAVVTDATMPVLSGLDLAREVARVRVDLPVVLTSGHLTEELYTQSAVAGIREVLCKPYSLRELKEVLDRVTRQSP